MSNPSRVLQALLRQSLSHYVQKVFQTLEPGTEYLHNWHIDHLCWQLTRVARGEIQRLIINVPPRSMKSITVSVAFTSWFMGHSPRKRVICASYADDLARKLSIDTRNVMESAWYNALFPHLQLAGRKQRNSELVTSQYGYRFAAGMNGALLGRGADLIVIDDPIKATDALSAAERRRVNQAFDSTLATRLNDKTKGAIVLIMQRLHQDDLVGHVIEKDQWEHVSIPAIETEDRSYRLSDDPRQLYHRRSGEALDAAREPLHVLESIRRAQGSLMFSAQYLQAPVPPEGNILKRGWLRYYERAPAEFDFTIVSWDTASTITETADYSVGTVWGAKGLDFFLLDIVRGRYEVPELRRKITALAQKWQVNQTVIEDGDMGRAICQDLRYEGQRTVFLKRVRLDKQARFLAQSVRFESGQIHVPRDASWLAKWLDELLAFPNGRHDDQVDSTSQALDYLTTRMSRINSSKQPRQRPTINRTAGFARPRA